jgi:hypothetical protein
MRIGSVASSRPPAAPSAERRPSQSPGTNAATTHPRYRRGHGRREHEQLARWHVFAGGFQLHGRIRRQGSPLHAAPKPDGTVSRIVAVA